MTLVFQDLTAGKIIRGPIWQSPIELIRVMQKGDRIQIVGVLQPSHEYKDVMITQQELDQCSIVTDPQLFTADATQLRLAMEAYRSRNASTYDPLFSVSISKIHPLPHQIEAVYGHILSKPTIRFLIGDDPGAGKTIMAGLVIRELKMRKIIERILIVVPGHLKDKWYVELNDKFSEKFDIIDSNLINNNYGTNVWTSHDQIITSMDFAKQERVMEGIKHATFDLVIVDEAHKMSVRYNEQDNSKDKTQRYKLGELLSRITTHYLFLSGSPHQGNDYNFVEFLKLLSPIYVTPADLHEANARGENDIYIRRLKEHMTDFDGKKIFTKRSIKNRGYTLATESPREMALYQHLSEYIKLYYNKAIAQATQKKRFTTFPLITLQRRLASSLAALLSSLQRRRDKLVKLQQDVTEKKRKIDDDDSPDIDSLTDDEWNDADREALEQKLEGLSSAENLEELGEEIDQLGALITETHQLIHDECEIKLTELQNAIKDLQKDHPGDKIIIFTEYKDTLLYLRRKVTEWTGKKVTVIHGGMPMDQRLSAQHEFMEETDFLIGTDATGEGIDLQCCHLMINYDLPWNPNRLEQRQGRIHRYLQLYDVVIINLIAVDTREGAVMMTLWKKIDAIKNAMEREENGMEDRIYSAVARICSDCKLTDILKDAATSTQDAVEFECVMNKELETRLKNINTYLDNTLITQIDPQLLQELREQSYEYKLFPQFFLFMFAGVLKTLGKELRPADRIYTIPSVPHELRKIGREKWFRDRFGEVRTEYKVTFDKTISDTGKNTPLMTFEHPLFEAVITWIERTYTPLLLNGATFIDPFRKYQGYIIVLESIIRDGLNKIAQKEITAVYLGDDGTQQVVSPSTVWDFDPAPIAPQHIDLDPLINTAQILCTSVMDDHLVKLRSKRNRAAYIKTKFGVEALKRQISEIDHKLTEYIERGEQGENMTLTVDNRMRDKDTLIERLRNLEFEIQQENQLILHTPTILTTFRINPPSTTAPAVDDPMYTNAEIEQIAITESLKYEKANGRIAVDVGKENLGFDIRSRNVDGSLARYIESKGRANDGSVCLTPNEWAKAEQLQDLYWLYVVHNAQTNPQLLIIQNPAKNLTSNLDIRRIISSAELKRVGQPQ